MFKLQYTSEFQAYSLPFRNSQDFLSFLWAADDCSLRVIIISYIKWHSVVIQVVHILFIFIINL